MVSKRRIALAGITAAVVAAGLVTTVVARAAAPACRVDYRVPSQWPGGFTGSVTVTNLGDPRHRVAGDVGLHGRPAGDPGLVHAT